MTMCYAVPRSVSVDRIRVVLNDVEYEWEGGFGAVLSSRERGLTVGNTRMIAGVLFHVAHRQGRRRWRYERVCWTIPNDAITVDWIRDFKAALLGCSVR